MTMRIAIAGGGGFAYILAREISQTANSVLVLSTQVSTYTQTILSLVRLGRALTMRWLLPSNIPSLTSLAFKWLLSTMPTMKI